MAKKKPTESLTNRILANSGNAFAAALSESQFFQREIDFIDTGIPMINVALSSRIENGLCGGVTTIAGESKRFKTLFGLYMLEAYQKKYPEGAALFYDTEFGVPRDYLKKFDLDWCRIVHVPITCVEELKHELSSTLDLLKEEFKNGEEPKLFVLIDSVGNMASRKEINDAVDGKEKADMTRAKQLKSFFRIVTASLKMMDIPCIAINHVYKDQSGSNPMFAATVVGGGQGIMLASDNVWVITRRQIGKSSDLEGYQFIINVEKSRFCKEKSQIPINVHFETGIHRYSGLVDLAEAFNIVEKTKVGKRTAYKYGELTCLAKDIDIDSKFWDKILEETNLANDIAKVYVLEAGNTFTIDPELETITASETQEVEEE